MKTSRMNGILVMKTNIPYKMPGADGRMVEQSEVVLKDIPYQYEGIGFELDQIVNTQMLTMLPKLQNMHGGNKASSSEDDDDSFFTSDCPKQSDIDAQAQLMQMILLNRDVPFSDISNIFSDFRKGGLICAFGEVPMADDIWHTVKKNDKLRIMAYYCSFFANPLQRLQENSL